MPRYRFSVDRESEERLDKYVANHISDLSRSSVQRLIENGHILVNGDA